MAVGDACLILDNFVGRWTRIGCEVEKCLNYKVIRDFPVDAWERLVLEYPLLAMPFLFLVHYFRVGSPSI